MVFDEDQISMISLPVDGKGDGIRKEKYNRIRRQKGAQLCKNAEDQADFPFSVNAA